MFINHDWRAHQAGLMAMKAIAKGTSNNMLNVLKNIAQWASVSFLSDTILTFWWKTIILMMPILTCIMLPINACAQLMCYLTSTWTKIKQALDIEFELYLPLVMPYILEFPGDLKCLIFHSVALTITIIIILNKYHQFRMQYKFISMNFIREKHIGFTAKNIVYNILGLLSKKIS